MKKILFIGLTAFIGLNASAQYKNTALVDFPTTENVNPARMLDANKLAAFKQSQKSEKKTRSNTVRYNIVDYVAATQGIASADMYSYQQTFGGTNPNGRMVVNYLWPDSTMKYTAASGNGQTFYSIGQVLDPTAATFKNQIAAPDVTIGLSNSYNVDSFDLFCSYTRKPSQAAIIDTLILSFVVEDASNLGVSGWTSGNVVTNFGADTVTFLTQEFDSLGTKPRVQKKNGGTALIIKKVLDQAAANDTISGGWNYYKFAPNLAVPAGKAVSVSVSFKPGTTWIANVDTIEGFNNFTFVSHEENLAGFFTYTKWDFNSSNVVTKTSDYIGNPQGWGGTYVPGLAYTAPYQYEFHNMDWIITCASCGAAGTKDLAESIRYEVSPNPASDNLNFSFTLDKAAKNVSLGLTNLLGQQVKNINLGAVSANINQNASVSVKDLPTGLYIYTIAVDGQKLSNKVLVK